MVDTVDSDRALKKRMGMDRKRSFSGFKYTLLPELCVCASRLEQLKASHNDMNGFILEWLMDGLRHTGA